MNERIQGLRERSLHAATTLSGERASLVTRFYQNGIAQKESVSVQRALCFQYVLEHKSLFIDQDELIVGERGPGPKATPSYPEICLHSLQDMDILNSREKIPYAVDAETRGLFQDSVIPFWQGKSIRERIFAELPQAWIDAYEAGVFTEFQEQRSPGHTALDDKIYKKGMRDFQSDIQQSLQALDFYTDPEALDKREQLRAMHIAAEAMISFARRHARALRSMAAEAHDPERKDELLSMAEICHRVPAHAPRTFWEALQAYWFVHLGVITELNPWDAFNPGRLDQHLSPFYARELEAGTLSREQARELLQAFWIKYNNHPAPPKVGVTSQESNTYVDFALINLGGVSVDNKDAVNDVSFLILEVIEEMRLLQPSSMVQLSKKNPDRILKKALEIIKTGYGQPSIFNAEAIVQELTRQGKSIEDARQGGASGCVEAGAFGRECYILTGYFNLAKILEITLHNGVDPRTGKEIGLRTGDPLTFQAFDELFQAYATQLKHFVDIKILGNNIIERINAKYMPVPFLSLLIDDCIARGRDYNQGGARYNTSYIQGVGLGSTTDALTALKYHVFDRQTRNLQELLSILDLDFTGHEAFREVLLQATPKYGNDDEYADEVLQEVFEAFYRSVNGRPNAKGGAHRINLLPTTSHVYFGSVIGALPDGRKSGAPLSEGISPVQGADRQGPTAVAKSASKIDHLRTGGTLLNQKFLPQILGDAEGISNLVHFIRSYFRMDGHHIQFNVVDAVTLRRAQEFPDEHRDLIVRVAGYSDYFVDLGPDLQEEIIQRTAHAGF
ncbi:MAG: glycyl radical protein [Desulfohalobiaceae bacterium]|nr:glycyl radical protein [Desulfohalobiaceae bacterium]